MWVAWPQPAGAYATVLHVIIALAIYLVPAAVALSRRHPQRRAIGATNVLLGWTLVAWAVAFVWSLTGVNGQPPREEHRARLVL